MITFSVYESLYKRLCSGKEYLSGCRDWKLKSCMVQPSSNPPPEKIWDEGGGWEVKLFLNYTQVGDKDRNKGCRGEEPLSTKYMTPPWYINQHCVVAVVQSLSRVWLFATPWSAARQASLSFAISWNLLKSICIESMMPYLTISSSVTSFSTCLQSFPTSGSFPTSQLFVSGGQSIGTLVSASVLPMNMQVWFSFTNFFIRHISFPFWSAFGDNPGKLVNPVLFTALGWFS